MNRPTETYWPGNIHNSNCPTLIAWLKTHGLQPRMIPVDADFTLDYHNRTITYSTWPEDPAGPNWTKIIEQGWVTVTLQLESPPRPIPPWQQCCTPPYPTAPTQ